MARGDWSSTHRALRFSMLGLAVLLFASARSHLVVDAGFALDPSLTQWIASPAFILALSVAVIYVAARFVLRTRLEWPFVAGDMRKLYSAVLRLDSVRKETAGLLKTFDGAMLAERLAGCAAELHQSMDLAHRVDIEALRGVGGRIQLFEALADRIAFVLQAIEAEGAAPSAEFDRNSSHWHQELRKLQQLLAQMESMSRSLDQQIDILEKTGNETKGVVEDATRYFSNSASRGVEDLHGKLDHAVSTLTNIGAVLRPLGPQAFLERRFLAVTVPTLLAAGLVLFSSDAILESAVEAFRYVEAAFRRDF